MHRVCETMSSFLRLHFQLILLTIRLSSSILSRGPWTSCIVFWRAYTGQHRTAMYGVLSTPTDTRDVL